MAINVYDKVMVRSGEDWFEGIVIDSICEGGVSFLVVDYINTNLCELAQAIVNITYVSMYVKH